MKKFAVIGKLRITKTKSTETLKLRLREREKFWMKTFKTFTPYFLT